MSSGRKYIEKMLEGVSSLDMQGNMVVNGSLIVTGSTNLSGSLDVVGDTDLSNGKLLYRSKMIAIGANTDVLSTQSGTSFVYLLTELTCSLPNGAIDPDGSIGSAKGSGMEFTFISLIEGGDVRITGSNQGGTQKCFAGSIVGSSGSEVDTPPVYSDRTYNQLNGIGVSYGDTVTFTSTGDLTGIGDSGGSRWLITKSSVKQADGIWSFAD